MMSRTKIRTGGSLEKHLGRGGRVEEAWRIPRLEPGLATLFKSSFGWWEREHTTFGAMKADARGGSRTRREDAGQYSSSVDRSTRASQTGSSIWVQVSGAALQNVRLCRCGCRLATGEISPSSTPIGIWLAEREIRGQRVIQSAALYLKR